MNESKQQYDSSHITPQKQYSQQSQQSPQNGQSSGTKPTPSTNGKSNAAHLTPLRVAEKTLEADDTLFSEAFVKKLTPRSMEACRLLGVLPEELVLRSYENFFEAGITPNIQKLRYQDYEQMRQETIAMVREERATLLAQGWTEAISPAQKLKIQQATLKAMMLPTAEGRSAANSPVRGASATHGRAASGTPVLAKSATTGDLHQGSQNEHYPGRSTILPHLMPEELLLEMEQDRLRKTMVRQNKEIESMMAYELKVAQMLAKQEQKLEMRRQKEKEAAELRREERHRQAEKRRQWELQKAEEEEKQKAANVQSMARLNAQEQKHLQELMEKDEERKREANRKAIERRKKKAELELRAQQNLEKQFELARERERDMRERDRRRRVSAVSMIFGSMILLAEYLLLTQCCTCPPRSSGSSRREEASFGRRACRREGCRRCTCSKCSHDQCPGAGREARGSHTKDGRHGASSEAVRRLESSDCE